MDSVLQSAVRGIYAERPYIFFFCFKHWKCHFWNVSQVLGGVRQKERCNFKACQNLFIGLENTFWKNSKFKPQFFYESFPYKLTYAAKYVKYLTLTARHLLLGGRWLYITSSQGQAGWSQTFIHVLSCSLKLGSTQI